MTQRLRPQRRLVALVVEQEAPEAEHQFGDDLAGGFGLALTADTHPRRGDVVAPVPVQSAGRVVVPPAGQLLGPVPARELLVQGVAQHHLEDLVADLPVQRQQLGVDDPMRPQACQGDRRLELGEQRPGSQRAAPGPGRSLVHARTGMLSRLLRDPFRACPASRRRDRAVLSRAGPKRGGRRGNANWDLPNRRPPAPG